MSSDHQPQMWLDGGSSRLGRAVQCSGRTGWRWLIHHPVAWHPQPIRDYDLPWNPNRIEQRLGRIHRIGQKKVRRLWNLVDRGHPPRPGVCHPAGDDGSAAPRLGGGFSTSVTMTGGYAKRFPPVSLPHPTPAEDLMAQAGLALGHRFDQEVRLCNSPTKTTRRHDHTQVSQHPRRGRTRLCRRGSPAALARICSAFLVGCCGC
jgi:hypothetical protein